MQSIDNYVVYVRYCAVSVFSCLQGKSTSLSDAENAGNLLEDYSGVKRRRRAASLPASETINNMLKNTAQIVHSRHRSVSDFIMSLISHWEHIASSATSQRLCRDTASKTPNSCHYSKGKTTSFCLLLLPTSNDMGRRHMHAAFILDKTLGYPELR